MFASAAALVKIGHVVCFTLHNSLYPFIFFNRNDRFMLAFYLRKFQFAVVLDFLLLQVIGDILLVVGDDTAIEGIFQHMGNDCGEPLFLALGSLAPMQFQFVLDFHQTIAIQIQIEDHSDRFCLLRINYIVNQFCLVR